MTELTFEECHENHIKMWDAIEHTKEDVCMPAEILKEVIADDLFDDEIIEDLKENSYCFACLYAQQEWDEENMDGDSSLCNFCPITEWREYSVQRVVGNSCMYLGYKAFRNARTEEDRAKFAKAIKNLEWSKP